MSLFSRLFHRRRTEKSSPTQPLIFQSTVSKTAWPTFDAKKAAQEGYAKNSIVYRCIDEVARSVASVPLELHQVDKAGESREITDHPALQLLSAPAPGTSQDDLIKALIGYFLISGNTYLEAVHPYGLARPPSELYVKRPDRMRVIPGAAGVAAYEFSINQRTLRFDVDPQGRSAILHTKTFNPVDDWYGLSPIQIAAIDIDQLNELNQWNYSLLKNGVFFSGALETEQQLDQKTIEHLRAQIKQKFSGPKNAGEVPVFSHGLSWKDMSINPADMAIIENKGTTARFICQAFGVPPFLLGLPDGATFSNVADARLYFWDNTVIPMTDYLCEKLTGWLLPKFDSTQGMVLRADYDGVTALEPRRAQKWDRMQKADFLTINEKRQALGYDAIDGGDALLVPATMLPLGESGDTTQASDAVAAGKMLELSAEEFERWLVREGAPPLKARALRRLYEEDAA